MMQHTESYRLIISGGGTGGHIFPAIAIAHEFRRRYPESEILFVGALGKMEMTRVPEAGYKIIGLWISGLQRSLTMSNLLFPFKLLVSYFKAAQVVSRFRPHIVVGTGGFASGPIMLAAVNKAIPTLIQEQNSFAGLTNRKLASRVSKVCVAYEGMEKYFPASRITVTGNPVRSNITRFSRDRIQAIKSFGLDPSKKTVLVIGGSLGARTLNECMVEALSKFEAAGVQVIWQTGKRYYEEMLLKLKESGVGVVALVEFISSMDEAYAAADLVVSRAGAIAISELCVVGKPVILVPSPNVADDHQTKNALALVNRSAAVFISDREASQKLADVMLSLVNDENKKNEISSNIRLLGRPHATEDIVNEIEKLIKPVAA